MTVNKSKKNDPAAWAKWHASGAIGVWSQREDIPALSVKQDSYVQTATPGSFDDLDLPPMEGEDVIPPPRFGVGHLTLVVWHENQRVPAMAYGLAQCGEGHFTVEVAKNARLRRREIGLDKALVHHFS